LPQAVHPIVSVEHSVRVEHGDDHEIKFLSELHGFWMVADQKLDEALECVARSDFSGMHSGGDEDERLMDFSEVVFIFIGE
jgi:hypothetical protein